jgi:hypothetical protein
VEANRITEDAKEQILQHYDKVQPNISHYSNS